MNKKIKLVLSLSLLLILFSCGGGISQEKVCACENLYRKMREQKSTYQHIDQMSYDDADKKVKEENKAEYDPCIQLQKKSERTYFKLSQKCGGNK